MKEIRKQKQLQSQLNTMLADIDALKTDISNKQKELSHKMKIAESLKKEIERIGKTEILKVSEHAIIRYFERVKGYDLEEIKKEILSEAAIDLINKLGTSGTYPSKDFQIVVKDSTVLTVK